MVVVGSSSTIRVGESDFHDYKTLGKEYKDMSASVITKYVKDTTRQWVEVQICKSNDHTITYNNTNYNSEPT